MKNSNTHGGRRAGSGPKKGTAKTVAARWSFNIPADVKDILEKQSKLSGRSQAKILCDCVRRTYAGKA